MTQFPKECRQVSLLRLRTARDSVWLEFENESKSGLESAVLE